MKRAKRSLLIVLCSCYFSIPPLSFSYTEPEYLARWLKALNGASTKERTLLLSQIPASLDCSAYRKDPDLFNPILRLMKDKDPSLRAAAVASLTQVTRFSKGCYKGTNVVSSFIEALKDTHPRVREEAAKALGYSDDSRAVKPLIQGLKDSDPWVRLNAVFSLGELNAEEAINPLLDLLNDSSDWRNKYVQQECVIAISKIMVHKNVQAPRGMQGTLPHELSKSEIKVKAFKDETGRKVISVLIEKSTDPYLRAMIIDTFGRFKVEESREVLLGAVWDRDEKIRKEALKALSELLLSGGGGSVTYPGPTRRIEVPDIGVFIESLNDPSVEIRAQSAETLGKLGDDRARGPLMDALRDSHEKVRSNAMSALRDFADEALFDAITDFIVRGQRVYPEDSAETTFRSVAEKTCKEWVYVYRKNGIRHVTKRPLEIPEGSAFRELMVHTVVVNKLIKALKSADSNARLKLLTIIGSFEDSRIQDCLIEGLEDPSPAVRRKAISLLRIFGTDRAVPRLIGVLKEKEGDLRAEAASTLGAFEDKRSFDSLMKAVSDSDDHVRAAALRSLGRFDDEKVFELNMRLLRDKSEWVRTESVLYIKKKLDKRSVDPLILLLEDANPSIAIEASEVLGLIKDERAVGPLIDTLNGKFSKSRGERDKLLRWKAASALGGIGGERATTALIAALSDKDVAATAIGALGALKDPRVVPALIARLSDENVIVRQGAYMALKEIGNPAGLEAIKKLPPDQQRSLEKAKVSTGSPIISIQPIPVIPKAPSSALGYHPIWRERPDQKEGNKVQRETAKPPPVVSPPTIKNHSGQIKKRETAIDIKPVVAKLGVNDPHIRREAVDTLGEMGQEEATDYLIPLLKDKDEYVRQTVARALGKLGDKKGVEPLIVGLGDPDVNVRALAAWALGEIQDPRAIDPLCASLFDKERKVKDQSFEGLRKFTGLMSRRAMVNALIEGAKKHPGSDIMLSNLINLEGQGVILKAMEDPQGNSKNTVGNYLLLFRANIYNVSDIGREALINYKDRSLVISELSARIKGGQDASGYIALLSQLKDQQCLPIFLHILRNRKTFSDLSVSAAIDGVRGLSSHDEAAVNLLLDILTDSKEFLGVRGKAARTLGKGGEKKAIEPLIHIMKNKNEMKELRVEAASALGELGERKAVPPLIEIVQERREDLWLRVSAISALGNIGDEQAAEPIQNALKGDSTGYIKNAAETALAKLKPSNKK